MAEFKYHIIVQSTNQPKHRIFHDFEDYNN